MKNSIDVFLKGNRNYIQGSQIIARLSDLLPEANEYFLFSASFKKITDNCLYYLYANDDFNKENIAIGSVIFKSYKSENSIKYLIFECLNKRAPLIQDDIKDYNHNFLLKEALTSNINLTVKNDFESVVECIVFFLKKLHSEHKKNVENIWFSEINNGNIPIFKKKNYIQADLFINNIFNKKINNKFLTLSKVFFKSLELNFTCNVTFAYDLL